jgi:hypothetical protein
MFLCYGKGFPLPPPLWKTIEPFPKDVNISAPQKTVRRFKNKQKISFFKIVWIILLFSFNLKSYFCELKPHAKFQYPTIIPSGRKVSEAEEREKEREKQR